MNTKTCPICGRPLSTVDVVLSEADATFQCRHCWNRMQGTGDASRSFAGGAERKPRVLAQRARSRVRGK